MSASLVSVVIDNYNYAAFLRDSIDSALRQSYPAVEVVVVDDGSRDQSRAIIAGYRDRIVSLLKENGCMGFALNAVFIASMGDIGLFLDGDDMMAPGAVREAVAAFDGYDVVKVQWPLWEIDRRGTMTGRVLPKETLGDGDFRELTIEQ